MATESDPLNQYYFLNKSSENYTGGTTNAVRDGDGGLIVEDAPHNSTSAEFAPRPVGNLPVRIVSVYLYSRMLLVLCVFVCLMIDMGIEVSFFYNFSLYFLSLLLLLS